MRVVDFQRTLLLMRSVRATIRMMTLVGVLAVAGGAVSYSAGPAQVGQDAAAAPRVLKVEGAVATSLTLTPEDLAKMPRATATLTSDGTTVTYEGVLLYDVLAKAGWQFGRGMTGKGMASYVAATARDGYQVIFTMAELDPMFAGEKVLIADKADGAALPGREMPFRVVAPGDKMHARSIYSVVKLEVVRLRP